MFWYLCQQIFKILIWLQLVCLRCFGYAVDDCRTGGSIDGIDHFPVLLAGAESADGTFTGVIIHRDIPIFKKYTQIPFLVQGIGKCFLCFAAFRYPV